ncbi:MAG: Holliday junction resolvase RuvX [Thermodesulfobacteriota bacterium]
MRVLGLDIGKKRTGVAVSDELGLVATPLKTIKSGGRSNIINAVKVIIEEYSVDEIVVGMPLNLNGSAGPKAEETAAFARALEKTTGIKVFSWDERLSTVAVTRVLIEADLSRARRKEVVDKSAAAYILQGYLDRRRSAP